MSVGTAVLEALKTEVRHYRGARVAHLLTVSGVDGLDILGVCLIDIV